MSIIKVIYYWFWHDFLCRSEPFTDTFRRQYKKYPWLWWLGIPTIISFLIWLLLHVTQVIKI